jgi:dephospho-CoA kinase
LVQENALIFENMKQSSFDAIITVTAPLEKRLERVINRDGSTEQEVLERIENQLNDEFKVAQATYVIHNTTLDKCRGQVNLIHKQLLT